MHSSSEIKSDENHFANPNSDSETGDGESQTSDDDDTIDLENLKLYDDSTRKTSSTSRFRMVWSSIPHRSRKENSSNDTIQKSGLTNMTENNSFVEDAFMGFMPQKILEKF